jgi:hypothetical protein
MTDRCSTFLRTDKKIVGLLSSLEYCTCTALRWSLSVCYGLLASRSFIQKKPCFHAEMTEQTPPKISALKHCVGLP